MHRTPLCCACSPQVDQEKTHEAEPVNDWLLKFLVHGMLRETKLLSGLNYTRNFNWHN